MKNLTIHGKALPVPSFFQVFNYGGGFGDKTREVVYADLTPDVPALFNYFYICNQYAYGFHSSLLNDLSSYDSIGSIFDHIREKSIFGDKSKYKGYPDVPYDFKQRVSLLDSGAANIVKDIVKSVDYDQEEFLRALETHMERYYDFADRYQFDLVVGFDLGGKYTFKDGEVRDKKLTGFYEELDKDAINLMLLKKAVQYIKGKKSYYPGVLATVHGKTRQAYEAYTDAVLELEKQYGYSFWGFALGGIAGSKSLDDSWFDGIDFSRTGKKYVKDAVAPARAARIVRERAGGRPIHALGCGGYPNIPMNYYCGATSFDSASPARRAGDGGTLSTAYVYDPNAPAYVGKERVSFSKMQVGGFDIHHKMLKEEYGYLRLCDVSDSTALCGCPACRYIENVRGIKDLYAAKKRDLEAHYLSRQLMNAHAINQNKILCEVVKEYGGMEEFCQNNSSELNKRLYKIYAQL